MSFLLCLSVFAAGETTIGGVVVELADSRLTLDYPARDGRTLRASLRLTDRTEIVRDGQAVRVPVAPGTVVRVTLAANKTVLRITLPDTPRTTPREAPDEEVIVDGELAKVDLAGRELVIEKTSGKKLTVKLDARVEVRLDGVLKETSVLKEGQTVRVGVFKKSRTVMRLWVYEVTERPSR